MNLPNKITVFRIFMIPFFVACMLIKEIPYHEIIAGVIFIIAALSDLVDGKIATLVSLWTRLQISFLFSPPCFVLLRMASYQLGLLLLL